MCSRLLIGSLRSDLRNKGVLLFGSNIRKTNERSVTSLSFGPIFDSQKQSHYNSSNSYFSTSTSTTTSSHGQEASTHHPPSTTTTTTDNNNSTTSTDSQWTTDSTTPYSYPEEVPGPTPQMPSRAAQVRKLSLSTPQHPYDVLIVGGGATGAGCALDAATRPQNLRVACIERGDFGSETSSRSTKLIWAGIRYLATASASLLSTNLFTRPWETLREFRGELNMVLNCHRERRYMLEKQPHLCNWVPIAIPFSSWYVTPAPFNHPLFSFFPMIAPLVLKFYDSLSSFSCPPSYIMGPTQAKQIFPQLRDQDIKYSAVFYEAQHNDARTNLAIAMSAAEHGADICNYVEMTGVVTDDHDDSSRVTGITAIDRTNGETTTIYAKHIVLAGGPFTDGLRRLENPDVPTRPAVNGAAGTHIVLPGYYCPNDMGLLDYNTSDGRFLFFVPWEKHTLVGTTDVPGDARSSPAPGEDEVQWLLNECGKYLSSDLKVRRSDVLSAWKGWRPLARDPHAAPGAPVSRDHVISTNPATGVTFVAGGKWTTWREMAEEVVDKVLGEGAKGTSKTLDITLFGGENYSLNLPIQLIQKYGMTQDTAEHLAKTYGSHSETVCSLSQPTNLTWPRFGVPLAPNYPYIDAEVAYACREYACTIEDVLSRRTRLAYLNKDAALAALPRVAALMREELGWSDEITRAQTLAARRYVETYGGRISNKMGAQLRNATYTDVIDIFNALDQDGNGYLDRTEVAEAASILGFPMSDDDVADAFLAMDANHTGRIDLRQFEDWWNKRDATYFHRQLSKELGIGGKMVGGLKQMGGGALFG